MAKKPEFKDKKLKLNLLVEALMRKWSLYVGATIRIVFYFKKRDHRLQTMLEIPESHSPGSKDHWQIKECGESIGAIPEEELQKIDAKYRDHFARAEKGLDTRLTCDALLAVVNGRASNIVFLVNDRDYVPLFDAIQYVGGNTYLTALDSSQNIQKGLANLCDKYLTLDDELDNIFGITRIPLIVAEEPLGQTKEPEPNIKEPKQ
ncbi:MAG: NYN domain-containing protein [Dehalococcoidia bacterium]|nr:MAG: NYN domain-containing protein [Dehalococcoidia bacterium]